MELLPYQQQVIFDLERYLEILQIKKDSAEAFYQFWSNHPKSPLLPCPGSLIEPYKNNIPKVPHVCIKVPTAGGKTFIACNALKTIFDAFILNKPKAVIWLVPSITILDQTIKHLKDPAHAYRKKINALFNYKVEVYDKESLLQGSGFNVNIINEQLNIMLFSFDSLRAKNKEDRKVFQENGNLQNFEQILGKEKEITLGEVIKFLNPIVIVDESHNAESQLSLEMLREVNPSFILDLTATPRKNSNIISFIDALELKKENMVKLPVIVYNYHDKTEVINGSLQLQKHLENVSKVEKNNGGKYIRPIVLYQVQPKYGKEFLNEEEEKTNVERLKEFLIQLGIPEAQIKIKTASINELKGIDLMSNDCEVRFIITINALKEGWDCPFAYILASLADKNSAIDVEQILGRVLRQPYVIKHKNPLLNLSYVLTASSKFIYTLDNIVKGLNKAGFSDKDYKLASLNPIDEPEDVIQNHFGIFQNPNFKTDNLAMEDITTDLVKGRIITPTENSSICSSITQLENTAIKQSIDFEAKINQLDTEFNTYLPTELQAQVKIYQIKPIFKDLISLISLPQFFIKIPSNELFGNTLNEIFLSKEHLLDDFKLSIQEIDIDFENIFSELYKVDLDESKLDHTPTFVKLDKDSNQDILSYLTSSSTINTKVNNIANRVMNMLGKINSIPDNEIKKYVKRVFMEFTNEQFKDFADKEYSYANKIKQKIKSLSENYALKKFNNNIQTGKVFLKANYILPNFTTISESGPDIVNSLYEKEGRMNEFETKIINLIANQTNIRFWTRNREKSGFFINGFIRHYPDFIIHTKGGNTILLETKGEHLDALHKIKIGNTWAAYAGAKFKYFLVYEQRAVDGAYKLEDFMRLMREL